MPEHVKQCFLSNRAGFPSLSSLRLLTFKNGRAVLLVNTFVIVHLAFTGGERETAEVEGCFSLDLPSQALERVADVTFCRDVVFLLDESGWICIL